MMGPLAAAQLFALLLVIAATVVGEHFPLSTFPMYSKWKPDTYLIYFTDKTGEPIAIQKLTHLKAGRYKGIFDSQLRVIKEANRTAERKPDLIADFGPEEYGIAGSYVLRWIDKNVNPGLVAGLEPLKPLKVWRREIIIIDGKLTHHDLEVASGQGPEPTPEVK